MRKDTVFSDKKRNDLDAQKAQLESIKKRFLYGGVAFNVLFPIYMLALFPQVWLVVLPFNFVVDSIVLLVFLKVVGHQSPFAIWKKSIIRVWLLGFLADVLCAVLLTLIAVGASVFESKVFWSKGFDDVLFAFMMNPYSNVFSFAVTALCIALGGWLIYFFNKNLSFRKTDLDPATIKKAALTLAIVTAPYLLSLPQRALDLLNYF